jgi:hypothetical protein
MPVLCLGVSKIPGGNPEQAFEDKEKEKNLVADTLASLRAMPRIARLARFDG